MPVACHRKLHILVSLYVTNLDNELNIERNIYLFTRFKDLFLLSFSIFQHLFKYNIVGYFSLKYFRTQKIFGHSTLRPLDAIVSPIELLRSQLFWVTHLCGNALLDTWGNTSMDIWGNKTKPKTLPNQLFIHSRFFGCCSIQLV